LSDLELRRFAAGSLAADDLLRADDHLSECRDCRQRATVLTGAAATVDAFHAHLSVPATHLSEEELQLFVQGRLVGLQLDAATSHVNDCATCAQSVDDLRSWSGSPPRSRIRPIAIAAAVLIALLIPAAVWLAQITRHDVAPSLAGFDALAPAEQSQVRAALDAGAATLPSFMSEIAASREVLMGSRTTALDTFALTAPVGTATLSDRPVFEWQPLPGALDYVVSIFDERSNVIARSDAVMQARWTPSTPIPRGQTYVWQVAARRGSEFVTAPAAPAPLAKFHILDAHSADVVRQMEAQHPGSHVVLGILSMQAGLRDDAARHFRLVPPTDQGAEVAQRSLERLQALEHRQ